MRIEKPISHLVPCAGPHVAGSNPNRAAHLPGANPVFEVSYPMSEFRTEILDESGYTARNQHTVAAHRVARKRLITGLKEPVLHGMDAAAPNHAPVGVLPGARIPRRTDDNRAVRSCRGDRLIGAHETLQSIPFEKGIVIQPEIKVEVFLQCFRKYASHASTPEQVAVAREQAHAGKLSLNRFTGSVRTAVIEQKDGQLSFLGAADQSGKAGQGRCLAIMASHQDGDLWNFGGHRANRASGIRRYSAMECQRRSSREGGTKPVRGEHAEAQLGGCRLTQPQPNS